MSAHFSWQSAVLKSECKSVTKLVLLVVGSYMNQHGGGAWPSYNTIAKSASLGRSTVIENINLAVEHGWLAKEVRPAKPGDNDTNVYAIAFPSMVVHDMDHPSPYGVPPVVHEVDPNTTLLTPHRTQKTLSGKPDDVREVLDFLNAKTNSGYRLVASNIEKISSRLKEGATVDEMKQVIARKCAEWMGTTMEKYLRPETLFNATKYNQYVGQLGKPIMRHGMDDRAAQMKLVADELTGRSTTNEYDPEDPFTIEASARRIA